MRMMDVAKCPDLTLCVDAHTGAGNLDRAQLLL